MKTMIIVMLFTILTSIYSTTGVVTDVDSNGNVVEVITPTGHIYGYGDTDDINKGDVMSLVMFDNGTPNDVTDDLVVGARYAGFSVDMP